MSTTTRPAPGGADPHVDTRTVVAVHVPTIGTLCLPCVDTDPTVDPTRATSGPVRCCAIPWPSPLGRCGLCDQPLGDPAATVTVRLADLAVGTVDPTGGCVRCLRPLHTADLTDVRAAADADELAALLADDPDRQGAPPDDDLWADAAAAGYSLVGLDEALAADDGDDDW